MDYQFILGVDLECLTTSAVRRISETAVPHSIGMQELAYSANLITAQHNFMTRFLRCKIEIGSPQQELLLYFTVIMFAPPAELRNHGIPQGFDDTMTE